MKRFLPIAAFCIIMLLFSSCTMKENESDKLKIVTTIFPAYDFARQIAQDNAEITMLLPPGTESHNFEPTAQQLIMVQECDLFICNGGESDVWVDSLLGSVEDLKIIRMMDCVDVVEEVIVEGMEEDVEEEEESIEYDEHVWTSPVNAVSICERITEALVETDSENAKAYEDNFPDYKAELLKLDDEFKEIVANASRKTIIFADRFPVRYFTEAYGLEYYAAFPGCASNTEPSASTVAFIIDKVNELNIPVVFAIEFSNRKMADTVAESTDAEILEFHSCHNVSSDDFNKGITYIELMKRNAEVLKKALN